MALLRYKCTRGSDSFHHTLATKWKYNFSVSLFPLHPLLPPHSLSRCLIKRCILFSLSHLQKTTLYSFWISALELSVAFCCPQWLLHNNQVYWAAHTVASMHIPDNNIHLQNPNSQTVQREENRAKRFWGAKKIIIINCYPHTHYNLYSKDTVTLYKWCKKLPIHYLQKNITKNGWNFQLLQQLHCCCDSLFTVT